MAADEPAFASITITKANHLRFLHLPQTLAAKAKYPTSDTYFPTSTHHTIITERNPFLRLHLLSL
ncbi:hypothetical protein JHK85_008440 [Glycine max]|uniref:Uncharacterized protein n=1 Tax=Glycine soja TaxID=3848 RepID=A0A0B2QD57_GLYSO|nr:hypothetical protein JHK85_008440 [Glycine max]KHN19205.1 hypothetical protein glysoja_041557 [Glycine soja]